MLFQNFTDLEKALGFVDRELAACKPRQFSPRGYNTGSTYIIKLELPGFSVEDIELSSEDRVLNISGRRGRNSHEILIGYGKSVEFDTSYIIPIEFDAEATSADLINGVLWLSIPKIERETKRIEINSTPEQLKSDDATIS